MKNMQQQPMSFGRKFRWILGISITCALLASLGTGFTQTNEPLPANGPGHGSAIGAVNAAYLDSLQSLNVTK